MVNWLYMNLAEIRKQNGLTQKEVAALVGIPYRTYVRYEEESSYVGTYKYNKIVEDLINKVRVDENHGVLSLEKIKELLSPLFIKYNITFCYLFGSYARNEARENSDVDLLVDTDLTGMCFLMLVEEIRTILSKKIDLLRLKDLSPNNPIVLEILKEGIRLI